MIEKNGTQINTDERGLKIRKAKRDDLKEVVDIFIIENKKKPYSLKWNKKIATNDFRDVIKKKEMWVGLVDSKLVGFIWAGVTSYDNKILYVSELWVKESFQGCGFGKNLLSVVEKYYKSKGVKLVRLTTNQKAKAFGFYKKLNYKSSKELILLEKKL